MTTIHRSAGILLSVLLATASWSALADPAQFKKDDLDQLYSLRLTGKKRIWGIKEGNILWEWQWQN